MKKSTAKIRTAFNYDHTKEYISKYEKDSSKTQPGQAEALVDVYNRLKREPEIEINVPTYNALIGADFRNMDKIERTLYRRQMYQKVTELTNSIKLSEEEAKQNEILELQAQVERLKAVKQIVDNQNGGANSDKASADKQ